MSGIATDVTGVQITTDYIFAAINLEDDIRTLTNLTALIARTPIANFTENIAWDALAEVFAAWGLDQFVDIRAVEALLKDVEDTIENPE